MLAQGQVQFREMIEIKTAHDMIRHGKVSVHGRCYVAEFGRQSLFDLPPSETDKLSLGDLGVDLMRALLKHR